MASIDLSKLSMDELKRIQENVERAIADIKSRQKQEAVAAAEAIAIEMGFSLRELITDAPKGQRFPARAKCRQPENPEVTWTGRGRKLS